jgi:hypothetical protein
MALPPLPTGVAHKSVAALLAHRAELPLKGPMVAAMPGDFRLDNGIIAASIQGLTGGSGGALLDLALVRGTDALRQLVPVVGQAALGPPRYHKAQLVKTKTHVALRLDGADPALPSVVVKTEYRLTRGENGIEILTTLTNSDKARALRGYQVGDYLQWGASTPFAPDLGRMPRGRSRTPWIGAWSTSVAYGYRADPLAPFKAALAPFRSETVLRRLDLSPGATSVVRRRVFVGGAGQLASVSRALFGADARPITLVVHDETGEPLPEAEVEVYRRGKVYIAAGSLGDGRIAIKLPAGFEYLARAHGAGRQSGQIPLRWTTGQRTTQTLRTGPSARLIFEVTDEKTGEPLACKLTIEGTGDSASPWFGAPHTAQGGNTILAPQGKGVLPLPPGRYRVTVSKGPNYSLFQTTVQLQLHAGASFVAKLSQVVDRGDYRSIDPRLSRRDNLGYGVDEATEELAHAVEDVELRRFMLPAGLNLLWRGSEPEQIDRQFKRWLALLRRGLRLPAIGASTGTSVYGAERGYPRTYVRLRRGQVSSPLEIATALTDGRTMATTGPFLTLTIGGKGPGETVSLAPRRKHVELVVELQAAEWVPGGWVQLYLNGEPWGKKLPFLAGARGRRLYQRIELPIARDGFVLVYARGAENLRPVVAADVPLVAVTSPIWIDANNDGVIDPVDPR